MNRRPNGPLLFVLLAVLASRCDRREPEPWTVYDAAPDPAARDPDVEREVRAIRDRVERKLFPPGGRSEGVPGPPSTTHEPEGPCDASRSGSGGP